MTENTRLKELQTEIRTTIDDLRRLTATVEKLQSTIDERNRNQDSTMDEIKLVLQQLLQNSTQTFGSPSNSNSTVRVHPLHSTNSVKDISLGFPHFDGSTPVLEWIFKVDKFFNYHNTPDAERVEIAYMHFENDVVLWFQMFQKIEVVTTWTALKRALESQFGPSPFDCPMTELFKLQQQGSVSYYYMKFMLLANRCEGLTEEAILNCFMSGLNVDIRRDVIALTPTNLLRAVALAKLYEEKYMPGTKPTPNYTIRYITSPKVTTSRVQNTTRTILPASKSSLPPLLPNPLGPPLRNPNVKRISPAEMQIRREKGLCYFCDEKFSFNPKCPNKQCFVLQLGEDESDNMELETELPQDKEATGNEDHHLSLNALKGGFGVGTIRFTTHIGTMSVKVLIDGGSSDNFLQPRVVKFLKLPVVMTPSFKVMVGNGNYMESEGLIQNLTLIAQGNVFTLSVFLLSFSSADLILGANWLKTIGPHLADYDSLQIKFLQDGRFTTLQGDRDMLPKTAQLHHIRRMMDINALDEIYSMQMVHQATQNFPLFELLEDMEPDLVKLLHNYSIVFSQPCGLPPPRSHDHSIPLLEGSNPVKVKPYRYPHNQKEEIENLVEGMLKEGILQPSNSPFSSPIILVKKKDGTWRVCTDYRALNAITIKDSFPIPTVDELIDELYGARYFSKLDLRSRYHQILLKPEDRHKTAFRTHQGLYEWLVVPFGLSNAPTTFQSLMNQIFKGVLRRFVLVFFDDILVYSSSWKDHLYHLEVVLRILQQNQLFAKFSKCSFGVQQIRFIIKTDQKSLKELLEQTLQTPEQQQ
ncbi:uncharacterized protein LOC108339268 [Vigna angularis]|uniref:uncharacterized protein LOC108339268 n=1 Tax=Phaseolus angularis TaxID=3914 RepID=UPI00080A0A90|nr:uncharacterized protein LOC108339268 [Vigna angularis]